MRTINATSGLLLLTMMATTAALAQDQIGEPIPGEKLDSSLYGSPTIESMADVIARDLLMPQDDSSAQRRARRGSWSVPSRRATYYPKSGVHNVINKEGDTRMAIGFPEKVNLEGMYVAGQASPGVWTTGLRVTGYTGQDIVGTTDWFTDISSEPAWFPINLKSIDRMVVEAIPVIDGAGWYAIDDLTYSIPSSADKKEVKTIVLDFEDCNFHENLTGTGYSGLTWETGSGNFESDTVVHPPQIPNTNSTDQNAPSDEVSGTNLRGAGTAPAYQDGFAGVARGDAGSWSAPPDTCGAIGPNHFVETVNRNLAVFVKSTGQRVVDTTLQSFMPGCNGDPRVLFDQYSNRWIITVPDFDTRIYLAVSLTDDPTGSWFKTYFTVSAGSDASCWPDYPTLGVDANGIYISSYMVGCGMTIFAIDKAPLVSASPYLGTITAWRSQPWEEAIQPAHTFGAAPAEYLVSTPTSGVIRLRRITGPLTSPTLTLVANVAVASYSYPPDTPALGSSVPLDSVGRRLMNAVYRNGSVWTTHAIAYGGRSGCRWYEIAASTGALIQSGTVSDNSLYFSFPSIMVDRLENVIMGFSGTNSSQYAGAYFTGRRATDPLGAMDDPQLLKSGTATYEILDSYGRNRWGDYSLCSLDPSDERTLWTIQEYVHSTDKWGTWIAKLSHGDCNDNGVDDSIDIALGTSLDCNTNGNPDECDGDCNGSGFPDECDVAMGISLDCNENNYPDECDILENQSQDCNTNGIPDDCDAANLLTDNPSSISVCPLDTIELSVAAPAAESFQWYRNEDPLTDNARISGSLTDTLTITNASYADTASYRCSATAGCVIAYSDPAAATVVVSAAIVTHPTAQTTCQGNTAAFSVEADGTMPVDYAWYHNGDPIVNGDGISGAHSSELQIENTTIADAGLYTCHVSNLCGGESSAAAELNFEAAISLQPRDTCADPGNIAVFRVQTDEIDPSQISYYWRKGETYLSDGGNVSGANTQKLTIANISAADTGEYAVTLWSTNCLFDSNTASLSVGSCPACEHMRTGDMDGDADYDLADLQSFTACIGQNITTTPVCACANVDDQNDYIDTSDWQALETLLDGPR